MPLDPLPRPGVLVLGGGGTLGEAWLPTVAAIGPNLFDVRRRADVEAAGCAQCRALAETGH